MNARVRNTRRGARFWDWLTGRNRARARVTRPPVSHVRIFRDEARWVPGMNYWDDAPRSFELVPVSEQPASPGGLVGPIQPYNRPEPPPFRPNRALIGYIEEGQKPVRPDQPLAPGWTANANPTLQRVQPYDWDYGAR